MNGVSDRGLQSLHVRERVDDPKTIVVLIRAQILGVHVIAAHGTGCGENCAVPNRTARNVG